MSQPIYVYRIEKSLQRGGNDMVDKRSDAAIRPAAEIIRSSKHASGGTFEESLNRMLCNPYVDKIIAVVAVSPYFVYLYRYWFYDRYSFVQAIFAMNVFIFIATMYLRRAPERVTMNPFFWILAFVALYGPFAILLVGDMGVQLVPSAVTNALAVVSFLIFTYARISLGRSVGIVPSQRGIVIHGAYRWVRHPIYTGIFVTYLGFALSAYSPVNVTLLVLFAGVFVIKSLIEERFLMRDTRYAEYMRQVRWRWVPGIA